MRELTELRDKIIEYHRAVGLGDLEARMLTVDAAKERKKAFAALRKSNALESSAASAQLDGPAKTGTKPIVQNITNNIRNYFRGPVIGGTAGGGSGTTHNN
jgi:hypothetical protein